MLLLLLLALDSLEAARCSCACTQADMAINFGAERYHNDFLPWDARLTEFFDAGGLATVSWCVRQCTRAARNGARVSMSTDGSQGVC